MYPLPSESLTILFFTPQYHYQLPNDIQNQTSAEDFLYNLFHPENLNHLHELYQNLPDNPSVLQLYNSISGYIQSPCHLHILHYITAFLTHYTHSDFFTAPIKIT